MVRWGAIVAVAALLGLAACGGGNDNGGAVNTTSAPTADATATTLDRSPFCTAIRELETMGAGTDDTELSQANVLEANAKLEALVDDAMNNAPQDAPADLAGMLADYRTFTNAVTSAAGDVEAAMAALEAQTPGFLTALSDHREAFTFIAERCGTAPPT